MGSADVLPSYLPLVFMVIAFLTSLALGFPGCELPVDAVASVPTDPLSVFLIAGHGNGGRDGNTGVFGQKESEVTLDIALRLELALEATADFEVSLGRAANERPSYDTRLERLVASGALLMIELHTDSRPEFTYAWTNPSGETVLRNDHAPGFSVLYNEASALGPERRRLAIALATELAGVGLQPYVGGYGDRYTSTDVAGVYIDRRGLKMLREPRVPSVIIETHHALDPEEAKQWQAQPMHDLLASGVSRGLRAWFAGRE